MVGNMQFLELGWPGFESWLSFFLVFWASHLPSLTLHFPICRMGASPLKTGSMTCNVLSVSGGIRLPLHPGATEKLETQGVCLGPCLLPQIRLQVAWWVALPGTALSPEWSKGPG